jgi:DNA invertase Pin-like site-specific DNA recombinase
MRVISALKLDAEHAWVRCRRQVLSGYARLVRRFETNLRRERHLEGIAKAKAAGVYKGRPASIDAAQVRAMKTQIAKALEIGRASVYRALEAG